MLPQARRPSFCTLAGNEAGSGFLYSRYFQCCHSGWCRNFVGPSYTKIFIEGFRISGLDGEEQACDDMGMKLFVLPSRSPKLNGHVERAQSTHTDEFYDL
jgi:hypothetical protein